MNDNMEAYLNDLFGKAEVRKNLHKAILFFLSCALKAKTLVPTRVGQKTDTALPRNGVKRTERLLKNKFFTMGLIRALYCRSIKLFIPAGIHVKLAVDWTIIRDKYCFLSISWVCNAGRSIPLYFTG